MDIFVPGRICLFGEHTDWAGAYRVQNPSLGKGYTIVVGTNQGIYADVNPNPDKLIVNSVLNTGKKLESFEIAFEKKALCSYAKKGDFYSYICGVACEILKKFGSKVKGLEINNYKTDLPIKKGLSSSAAISVLTARSFNKVYNLDLSVRDEMELAYLGERNTPSQCGKMDQGCAFGKVPILMTFDGEELEVKEIKVAKPIYLVIVDLGASKNTKLILEKLNASYPEAKTKTHKDVQKFLSSISGEITLKALKAIEQGNLELLGQLMNEAQSGFDAYLTQACPEELTSPILHKTLNHSSVCKLSLGGKGVGSQGDGSAQFLVENEEKQLQLKQTIEDELEMECLTLKIPVS
jgi:galactokinase